MLKNNNAVCTVKFFVLGVLQLKVKRFQKFVSHLNANFEKSFRNVTKMLPVIWVKV